MVLIYRTERKVVYEYLLENGVIVYKYVLLFLETWCVKIEELLLEQDWSGTHKDTNVHNLKVHMILKSLRSRGCVELVYCW